MDNSSSAYISIVMPTRNRPELLSRALHAIQAQSYKNFEVIVIDDGSDKKTQAVYDEIWLNLDGRFIRHTLASSGEKGYGPSIARNLGLSLAQGSIVTFCDDDDFWTSDTHLNDMAAVFTAHPEVDIYIANQTGVSPRGTEIHDWFPALTSKLKIRSKSGKACGLVSVQDLCEAGGFAHLNILSVRKSVIDRAGDFWERISYEEDRDFFWRAVDCGRAIYFNAEIIGQHNIPDPQKKENQSTQHSVVERLLLSALVCQHIATSVKHQAISSLARRYEGDILRRLALHFAGSGKPALGFAFARQALSARFSLKWSGYMALLGIKSLLTGTA